MHTRNLVGFPSGWFYIKSVCSNKVLDVCFASTEPGAEVIMYHLKKLDEGLIDNQLWRHEAGYLINKRSGMCLDITGGRLALMSRICQSPRKPNNKPHNQRWIYTKDYKIASMDNEDMVLDIENCSTEDFASVILYSRKSELEDHENQQWVFIPAGLAVVLLR
ncbi:1433_t:CDS:2 [Ambispora leptoticha]|uniref:1433_t:CDS:1 n=1 Tax=Ambispora leptoticha TaxID=144679 RepID=A0A9N9AF31_9GLOM|nr:1433_t:CDS:2 [Ambispora leptoticha]